jgi:8-oxo-dGTP pyrophosphatase MutT (NUDIX family)
MRRSQLRWQADVHAELSSLPIALVVARHADKTLLVFDRRKCFWELPGGMLENGETPRACACA